jgi:hypothetical protein
MALIRGAMDTDASQVDMATFPRDDHIDRVGWGPIDSPEVRRRPMRRNGSGASSEDSGENSLFRGVWRARKTSDQRVDNVDCASLMGSMPRVLRQTGSLEADEAMMIPGPVVEVLCSHTLTVGDQIRKWEPHRVLITLNLARPG